jgi:hypothetical protein
VSRNRLLAVAAVVLVGSLTGCGAGQHDATSGERATPYQADANIGALKVRAVTVTLAGQTYASPTPTSSPSGPPLVGGSSVPPDTQAFISVVIVNDGTAADGITGASIPGGQVSPTSASASPTIEPKGILRFVDPEVTSANNGIGLAVTGLTQPLQPGTTIPVTFSFQTAGQVTIQAPVMAAPTSSS